MSQPAEVDLRFRVTYSGRFRAQVQQLLERASEVGRFAEIAAVLRGIHTRLEWIPLDFGEPLVDHVELKLREYVGTLAPIAVTYAVDEERRIVYVSVPFRLYSNSGL